MIAESLTRCDFDGRNLLVKVEIIVPGKVESIPGVVQKIMDVVNGMGCAAGREFEIELVVSEALANAIRHGCANDPSKQVQCCVACDYERGMLIVIRDPGRGFDPASVPNPLVGQNLFAAGGRGIYLINQLVDAVWFEKGGTEIYIRMNPPAREGIDPH